MAVSFIALADDPAVQKFQSSKQSCGPVTLIIVSHRTATALFDWQPRLGAVEGLDLTFLIQAQHHCLLGRIQIQPHHVRQFFQKLRIPRQFEGLDSVWLQIVAAPDGADSGFTQPLALRHQPATPLGHSLRLRLQGGIHDVLDLL